MVGRKPDFKFRPGAVGWSTKGELPLSSEGGIDIHGHRATRTTPAPTRRATGVIGMRKK